MENLHARQIIDACLKQCALKFLARSPPLAVIVLILCGIIVLPAIIFLIFTIVALFLVYLELLEIPGEMMLFKIMFFGFLTSVGIIFSLTSGTIFAWYYGLSRMYQLHFSKRTPKLTKQHPH